MVPWVCLQCVIVVLSGRNHTAQQKFSLDKLKLIFI